MMKIFAVMAFLFHLGCASQPKTASDLKANEGLVFLKVEIQDQNGAQIPDLACAIIFGESGITRAEGGAFQKRAPVDANSFAVFKVEGGARSIAGLSCNEGFMRAEMPYTATAGAATYIGHFRYRMKLNKSFGTELKKFFAVGTVNVGSVEYGVEDRFKSDHAEFVKIFPGFSSLKPNKSVVRIQ